MNNFGDFVDHKLAQKRFLPGSATSQSVASSLLYELTRSDADENGGSIRLNSEEHLKWCMQVLNHSLTLSFATSREYETLKDYSPLFL
ncbi:hypothetical protein B9Z55_004945 [Caenorhabditis nigoni]|nr:hypothetical protein B9Z55_004945 [Caenorhabditis nigoni]